MKGGSAGAISLRARACAARPMRGERDAMDDSNAAASSCGSAGTAAAAAVAAAARRIWGLQILFGAYRPTGPKAPYIFRYTAQISWPRVPVFLFLPNVAIFSFVL